MTLRSSLPALALLLAACNGAPLAAETIGVVKTLGSVQCEGGGSTLPQLQQQLESAGIKVRAARCATDGRMRVAMCGAPDGRLALFDIAQADLKAAAAQGFAPVRDSDGVRPIDCR